MNKTTIRNNRMMMNRMKMTKMTTISNSKVVVIKMRMRTVLAIKTNSQALAKMMMTINNNQNSSNSKRRTKNCRLLKWSIDNSLNSLSFPLY